MIIQALEEEFQLRYTDLREKINSRCQDLGLKKPSNDAFYSRLNNLCKRDVLHKEKDKYGAHYSLKNNHYKRYLEEMLFLGKYCAVRIYIYNQQSGYEKSNKIIERSENEESSKDRKA